MSNHQTGKIYSLIKFGEKEHMEMLRETGRLRMLRLAAFQAMEDNVGRGDRDEGLSGLYQPEKVVVTWGGITLEGFVGPIRAAHDVNALRHVFCLVAVTSRRLEALTEGEPIVPVGNIALGKWAVVITNVSEFIERVKAATARANLSLKAGSVGYVDPKTYSGEMGAFMKFDSYAHQCEWRIVLPPTGDEVYWLDLGSDLKDISVLAPAAEVNEGLKVAMSSIG